MITVSVKHLISAIEDADAFKLPETNDGTDYLYKSLYKRLTNGENVCLSEIDYTAFELDDIEVMRDIYNDVLEANEGKANSLTCTLQRLAPVVTASAFV